MAIDETDIQFPSPRPRRRRHGALHGETGAPAAGVSALNDGAHAVPVTSSASPSSVAFHDVSDEVWSMPEIEAFTVRAVETVLRRRGVEPADTKPPNMEIAVPAIEAMRYSPLREEIATLIASSMDGATDSQAHPAFLTILKQVTRDEIRILQRLPDQGQIVPMAHIHISTSRDQFRILQRSVVPVELMGVCDHPERMAGYIDNLVRLQLLEEPDGIPLPDASFYSALTKQEACQQVLRDRNTRRRSRIEKRMLSLTDFGTTFRQTCLR